MMSLSAQTDTTVSGTLVGDDALDFLHTVETEEWGYVDTGHVTGRIKSVEYEEQFVPEPMVEFELLIDPEG